MDPGTDTSRPSKRAKYTPAACMQCKHRKAKCVRNAGEDCCERCRSFGEPCTFPKAQPPVSYVDDRLFKFEDLIRTMQRRIDRLEDELRSFQRSSPSGRRSSTLTGADTGARPRRHRQLPFVGRTRPAFSLDVARSSMREMGLSSEAPGGLSMAASPEPELSDAVLEPLTPQDPLFGLSRQDIMDAISTFREEVHSVYPFVDIEQLSNLVETLFAQTRSPLGRPEPYSLHSGELMVLRVAVAVGKVIQSFGANHTSRSLVEFVEFEIFGSRISSQATYLEAAATALMSLYYFHIDQELLAWRTISFAARMALELGLHRQDSLMKNFSEPEKQALAVRLFWCIYVLDRRWSIGIGLPFTLQDADIDPDLPEPHQNAVYLQCMIKYGRICSKVWYALPSFGPHAKSIPEETVSYLEFQIQNWINSVPEPLRWSYVQTSLNSPTIHDAINTRLSALLHLRSIHMRILINRHHILSTANIRNDPPAAQRVVELAKDAIQVLVQLNENSTIYLSQQVAFNFFLISSLAVIFLAVTHDPSTFGHQCKQVFFSAVELVRGLSARSHASRRLWKSVRHLQGDAQKLGLHHPGSNAQHSEQRPTAATQRQALAREDWPNGQQNSSQPSTELSNDAFQAGLTPSADAYHFSNSNLTTTNTFLPTDDLPDIDQMTSDMTDWYEVFGLPDDNGNVFDTPTSFMNKTGMPYGERKDYSRLFQEMITI